MIRADVEPSLQLYLRQIQQSPLLTEAEEKRLGANVLGSNCPESRDRMIRSNLRLVVAIAKRYAHCGLPLSDLIEEGNLGLVRAVESFDPGHGARFSTYASWWIKQAIRRALTNTVQQVRVPAYMVELIGKWKRASRELEERLGRAATPREIAEAMQLPLKKVRAIQAAVQASQRSAQVSVDHGGEPMALTDTVADERTPPPGQAAELADQILAIRRFLSVREPREARILRMRYGLDGEPPLTLKQIGEAIGLTRERVRQLEIEALKKLQQRLDGERQPGLRASA